MHKRLAIALAVVSMRVGNGMVKLAEIGAVALIDAVVNIDDINAVLCKSRKRKNIIVTDTLETP